MKLTGRFFFGAVDKFKDTIRGLEKKPNVLILRMRHVPTIDASGLSALENVFSLSKRDGTRIILAGLQSGPHKKMRRAGLLKYIEDRNILLTIDQAIGRSRQIIQEKG